jgi:hypothetical protein
VGALEVQNPDREVLQIGLTEGAAHGQRVVLESPIVLRDSHRVRRAPNGLDEMGDGRFRQSDQVWVNRTQALVLGFFLAAWLTLIGILVVAPDVFSTALTLPAGGTGAAEVALVVTLGAFIGLLGVGIVRRWRWMFWLLLVAFLAGVLRVPASLLELVGVLPVSGPTWYVLLQAAIGLVQFAIGLAMLSAFRRAGVWGGDPHSRRG